MLCIYLEKVVPHRHAMTCRDSCLKEDLDENSGARGCVVLGDPDCVQDGPRYGVCRQQVSEEFGDVPQLVGLQPVDEGILLPEALLIQCLPTLVVAAVPLGQQAIVPASR